jgi:hypothetical protein
LDKVPKRRNVGMRFGTWNMRSFYRAGSIMSFEGTIQIQLDLVGVQEVRLEGSGTSPAGENTLFYGSCSQFTDSCHPNVGGAKFLRNVGSYKSHTA